MVKQWRNEDIIAPADAQRWEDGVDKTLKENVQNAGDLKKHAEDKSNPHGVTAAQTGAYTKSESDANDQETLTTAKQYTDEKKQEANTFTSQEVAKVKTDIQNGNVASASKLNTARKINGVDFDGTKDINVTANPNQRTIPANTTLDDLIEPGFWTSHSNGNTATLTNAPFGVNTFTLQVGTGLENGRIFQTAKSMGDGSVAVRRKREDTQWSGWVRLARADGTMQTGLFSETADRLRTSRKIAGVDFDGRADIAIAAGNVGAYTKGEVDKKLQDEIGNSIDNLDVATRNYLIDSYIERTGRNEFLNDPSWNLAPLIDEYGMDREYTISFDLKSAVAGQIRVYSQNGSTFRYNIGTHIFNATTEYQRYSLTFKPEKSAAFETETRSLLAFFGTYGTGRIPTVRNVFFGLGNITGDWMPNLDELAKQESLEEMNQKVQTLEQNTIRLTNQFPDPDFSKGIPRPVAEGGIGVNYNDGVGVVLNNPTAVQGRIYWGSPPLGLMVGKTYNVSMYLNAGGASAGRVFIAGTSTGDNFSFSVPNDSPVWVHGTIGLTIWSAFSVWLPPNTSLRIRELYIYEANTDITTARIERLEKDNSLPRIAPAFAAGFMTYNADPASTNYCAVERQEDWITLHGAITNTVVIPANSPAYVMCTLPVGYRPDRQERGLMQGSGSAKYLLHVETNGEVTVSRYSGHSQVGMHDAPIGSWLTTNIGYKVGG